MAVPSTAISRTELSVGFREFDLEASRRGFIGPSILRPRLVGKQAADIGQVDLEQLLRTTETQRAPKAGYARDEFSFGKASYSCVEHGAEEVLDDALLAMYSDIVDAETIHAGRAQDRVLRNYEIAAAAAVFDTGVWTGASLTTAVGTRWDVAADADPIGDVKAAARIIWDATGLWPNTIAMNRRTFDDCVATTAILDRVRYGGDNADPARVSAQALAAILGLDQVLVAQGAKNAAKEGQTADIDPIWADGYAMLCRTATTEDIAEPCIGRTFLWPEDGAGAGDNSQIAVVTEEYREEGRRGSVIRARTYYQVKILLATAGHLLSNLKTP